MNFDLGEVLTRTWKIGWNHKVLWLWQMTPGILGIIFMPLFILANPAFLMLFGGDPETYFTDYPWIPLVFMAVMFIFAIPAIFLSVMAQLTTTYGAIKVEKGAEKLAFMDLFRESLPYFWRVLGVYAIFAACWMVIWFGFMFFFMAGSMLTMGLASLCFIPFFFLFIPVLIVGLSVVELAQNAIIADDMGVMDAISHGWKLFRANWLGIVILMIVLYFAMYILSMVITFPMMFPMMFLPLGFNAQGEPSLVMMILFFAFTMLIFLGSFIVQGISMAFFQTGWAVLYQRINRADNAPVTTEAAE